MTRFLKHIFIPHWWAHRAWPKAALAQIGEAIRASETRHRGELRFVIEAGLPLFHLLRRRSARDRARELFSRFGVGNTLEKTGVLVYVQLIDRNIEIVADSGISARVEQPQWDAICRRMEAAFRQGRFVDGARLGIDDVTDLLARHFPARADNPNELPDEPLVM